jgi:hypothetical protein
LSGFRVYQDLGPFIEAASGNRTLLQCNLTVVMVQNFDKSLSKLKNRSVSVSASNQYPEQAGEASVQLAFADGSKLRADFWRVTKDGRAGISSFDHQQQYGLPAPIDAITELRAQLQDKTVNDAKLDESGDLLFEFSGNIKFRVFNFTAYEAWEIHFPDGTGEYSNYAK